MGRLKIVSLSVFFPCRCDLGDPLLKFCCVAAAICLGALQSSKALVALGGPASLGYVFMKAQFVVFDVGAGAVGLANVSSSE